MPRHTSYPYELTTNLPTDKEQRIAQSRGTYLICLFFVVLTALAIVTMIQIPPTWDLIQ